MLDYESLKFIWWVLIGVLLIGFAITDGFDMGVGAVLPFMGKKDEERRVMINTLGPHWEGNQVWLVTAGGALFAAWPQVYALAFSGFYIAMILVLAALFFRPVGFDYRSKVADPRWRSAWDWGIFAGSAIPAVVFGVAFGNLLQGVPFTLDEYLRVDYQGSFWALLNPFALICGLVSLSMLITQGCTWLQMKTTDDVLLRARATATVSSLVCAALFLIAGLYLYMAGMGYEVTSVIDHNGASNPLLKTAEVSHMAWFNNYGEYPLTVLAPVVGVLCALLTALFSLKGKHWQAFLTSSLTIAGVILTAGISMFPFVIPSSIAPEHSLTAWDATSSEMTMTIMFFVALVFVPIVLGYTLWGYYKMAGRLNNQFIQQNDKTAY